MIRRPPRSTQRRSSAASDVYKRQGEEEYDPYVLKRSKTIVETIEEEADFTPEKMVELEKKYHPERIIIEYNGMWKFRDLRLPWHWKVEQQITTIDASTFPMYFTNMKSMVSDMIRKSEMIIFNRCDGIEDLNTYKRNVKALNQTAEIIFEDQDGEIDEIMEEDLPYDLKADKIVLDDNTYGIWYLDSLDHVDRYVGKTIEFIGMVMKPEEFPKGYFVPGRMAMTCCAEAVSYTHLRAHETRHDLVCRLLLEKKKNENCLLYTSPVAAR